MRDTFDIIHTTVPANSQTVIPIDSTYRLISGSQASMHATTGAFLTPGPYRSIWEGATITWSCKTTTQDVTLLEQILTGVAGTSADWEDQGVAGSHTITAGTTSVGEFKPLTADWRIRIDAGGTGPATIVFRCVVSWTSDFGN